MVNTQKIINNILGKQKTSRRTLRQNKVNLDNINTVDELQTFLNNQDIGYPSDISGHVTMVFGDGEITTTKAGKLFGMRTFHLMIPQLGEREFITLKHKFDDNTFVTLSGKYNYIDISKCMNRIYGQALIDGKIVRR